MLNVNQLGNSPVQQPNFKGKGTLTDGLNSDKPIIPKHQRTEAEQKVLNRQMETFLKPFVYVYKMEKMEKEAPEEAAKIALKYRLLKEPNIFERNITKFLLWLMSKIIKFNK